MSFCVDINWLELPDKDGRFENTIKSTYLRSEGFRNCYYGNYQKHYVKMRLHNANRILGQAEGRNRQKAVRFADAALLFFWKYRKTLRGPLNDDFNFGIAQAQEDMARPDVLKLLRAVEQALCNQGMVEDSRQAQDLASLVPANRRAWKAFCGGFFSILDQLPAEYKTRIELTREAFEKFSADFVQSTFRLAEDEASKPKSEPPKRPTPDDPEYFAKLTEYKVSRANCDAAFGPSKTVALADAIEAQTPNLSALGLDEIRRAAVLKSEADYQKGVK